MSARDVVLALAIVAVWGANFTVIKIGLEGIPPLLLAALRYVVVALPAVLFVRRPNVAAGRLIAYGLTVGVGQFGALFYAMYLGMPAGLSSVVLQSQPFFTLVFAYWMLREPISWRHVVGMAVAVFGLLLIAAGRGDLDGSTVTLAALVLTLIGAASWGLSNVVIRLAVRDAASRDESVDMFSLVVWSALIPPLPLLAFALLLHGPAQIGSSLADITWMSVFSIGYIAYGATLFGFGGWSKLLAKYPANTVAPFSLLVPVTGLLTAHFVLSEQLSPVQWLGSACIVAGLVVVSAGVNKVRGNPLRSSGAESR